MKKILILLLILIFMLQLVDAAEVCVVVDYGKEGEEETDSKCVDIEQGKNGYELMQELGWSTEWLDETFICKVNDIGNDPGNCFGGAGGKGWLYTIAMDSEWFMPLAFLSGSGGCWNRNKDSSNGHYCTEGGDVLGLVYTSDFGARPEMFQVNITKIYVDGDKLSDKKTRKGKIEEVFPESEVKFKIELENLYHHSTDIEITDISIEGFIEEIADGDDIEEYIKEFDLAADRKTTKELEFTIPLEVEAKDRLVRIELKAEDDARIKYEMEFTYDLEVEKENHDVRILKAELNKDAYRCGENVFLQLSFINIGAEDEDVDLEITNAALGININENFELSNNAFEESSKYEKRFNIWLPGNASKWTYLVTITANYDDEKETETVDLVISECGVNEVEDSEEITDIQIGDISEEEGIEEEIVEEEKGRVKEKVVKSLPLVLTVFLVLLVVLIIVLFVMFLVTKE